MNGLNWQSRLTSYTSLTRVRFGAPGDASARSYSRILSEDERYGTKMKAIHIPRWAPLVLATIVAFAWTDAMAAKSKIKCWTNKDGFRECGNIVPPEYAQQGHEEINERGLTVNTRKRAKTPEEIEAEHKEQERLEAQRKLDEEQATRDRILLATYATEYDMRLAHKGKVAAIDSRIAHAKHLVKRLKENLVELIQDAANQERSGKEVSDQTLSRISDVKKQMAEQNDFIKGREQEKALINARFEDELAHFRRLKAR